MTWQDQVRGQLPSSGDEQAAHCHDILDDILAAYERGGPDAVADAIRQRLQVIETAFDEQLRHLEAKL